MNGFNAALVTAALVIVTGLASAVGGDTEERIDIAEVPDVVLKAAEEAVPGIVLEVAEVEREGGRLVYDLEGTAEGRRLEVEVTEEGEVLEIEDADDVDDDAMDDGDDDGPDDPEDD